MGKPITEVIAALQVSDHAEFGERTEGGQLRDTPKILPEPVIAKAVAMVTRILSAKEDAPKKGERQGEDTTGIEPAVVVVGGSESRGQGGKVRRLLSRGLKLRDTRIREPIHTDPAA
jgi:hypothetical protein